MASSEPLDRITECGKKKSLKSEMDDPDAIITARPHSAAIPFAPKQRASGAPSNNTEGEEQKKSSYGGHEEEEAWGVGGRR